MSQQLIVQGLPDIDEVELHRYISRKHAGEGLESCIIIRDRETKRPRGFGFLQFYDAESARYFCDEWRDGGLEIDGYRLRIDYSKDARNDAGSWICDNSNCRASNYARREICFRCDRPRTETDFTKDMGTLPSQFLQVRDLYPDTTAQHIVTAITKLQGVQIRRLLMVEGREAEHVPVAFVEFRDSEAAAQALALAAALPGKGFSVKGKPAGLSFVHVGVFVPVYGNVEPGVFKATDSAQLLAYWNSDYRCSVFIPENAIPEAEVDFDESRKRKDNSEHSKRKKSKALGTGVTVKSGSGGMISHWSKKQEELNEAIAPPEEKPTSYADLKIMACLLCSRKFKMEAELNQHESQSDLHRKNLSDSALVAKANERVRARNPDALRPPPPPTEQDNSGIEYRNRALERRIQIKQAGGTIELPTAKHKKHKPRSASPEDQASKTESKGRQLMSKMGYVSGGLGSTGQGRAEIVKAETYLPGVGLGSQGGKLEDREAEARRGTGSYSEFVASVKENARSRYDREQGLS